ncbi:hypothetical protein FVE85_0548 [Porphyridium purpureum]|uniref:Uncharacterized protein n=1 Tax=Porphyridium purpureum TaxID=35688 RepID=A0A5J4YYW9_PORPP|nr:hypothetical protein FVE85_0548 [Porphyridium purpureum]|eukprot:POR3644..scf208_2
MEGIGFAANYGLPLRVPDQRLHVHSLSWSNPAVEARAASGVLIGPSIRAGRRYRMPSQKTRTRSSSVLITAMSGDAVLPQSDVAKLAEAHEEYIREQCAADPPRYLAATLRALELNGEKLCTEAGKREADHPLVIPLARDEQTGAVSAGLLRWPTPPSGMDMPLVATSLVGPGQLCHIANSCELFIRRQLAYYDFLELKEEFTEADKLAPGLYDAGQVMKSGMGLHKYLMLNVGPFMDVLQTLARGHLDRGDEQSALITCEKMAQSFPGWSHAHAFHARMLASMSDRELEARDAARFAIHLPLMTLDEDLDKVASLAGFQDPTSLGTMFRGLSLDPRESEVQEGKAPEQVSLDRAAYLLDRMVAERTAWNAEAKNELAELYEQSRLPEVARFVRL